MAKRGKKAAKRIVIVLAALAGCVLLVFLLLLIRSTGKVRVFMDQEGNVMPNSLSEKVFVEINGSRQGMFIQSENMDNPVLLILHGGPGMPEYFLTGKYPTGLEKNFTVVWWDQRGAGLSYDKDIKLEELTLKQYIEDTIAVTNYLRERFSKEKIYLLAHSFGTYIGIQAVKEAPELYYAYLAQAQITSQVESERLAYDYMLKYYQEKGDEKTVKKLAGMEYTSKEYQRIRDSVMHKAGIGTTRDMKSIEKGVFLESLLSKEYTLKEKINIWRGRALLKHSSLEQTKWSPDCDIREVVPEIFVPIYFLSGAYDYTVNYQMAKDYCKEIIAPLKAFYTFENSAHSPMFEEPERFNEILVKDVLNLSTYLADD